MPSDQPDVKLGQLDQLFGYHLRRASSVVHADFSRALAGTGVRQVLFGILSIVAENPGVRQGEVGSALGIQRANMVGLINEVVELGWVERTVAAEDRRAFALALTAKGRAALADAADRIRAHEDALLADLDAGERELLVTLLRRIERKGG